MLNNYLIFLDLDTEMVMLQFADGLQSLHFEKTGSHTNPKPKGKKQVSLPMGWRRFLTTDLILGGVVILVILGLVIWGAFQLTALSDSGTKSSNSSISDILMQTSPTVTGTEPANNSKMAPGVKPNNGQSGGGQNAPAPTGTLVFAGSGPLQINIVSNQRAYMRIIVDGKTVFDGRVLPGNAYPYSGTQEIELLTGNAGAFKVSTLINGTPNDMGSLGSVGEVKSLIFTNQGIITPTPKFTATATITPPATETPQVTNTPLNPTITPFIPQS